MVCFFIKSSVLFKNENTAAPKKEHHPLSVKGSFPTIQLAKLHYKCFNSFELFLLYFRNAYDVNL